MILSLITLNIHPLCRLFSGGAYWLRFWSILQHKETTNDLFMKINTSLEIIVLEMFASHGWKHNNRLCQAKFFGAPAIPAFKAGKIVIIEGCVR